MYIAYLALVVCFVMVIVLHAWCVRRLASCYDRLQANKMQYKKLRMEASRRAIVLRA